MDITQIVEIVVALLFAIITTFVVPYIRKRASAEQLQIIEAAADTVVLAAEKLKESGFVVDKLAYADKQLTAMLGKYGIVLDTDRARAAIEAAVKRLDLMK